MFAVRALAAPFLGILISMVWLMADSAGRDLATASALVDSTRGRVDFGTGFKRRGAGFGGLVARRDPRDSLLRQQCDYAITLALRGESAGAETVFAGVLSESPGDSRALNGLGNIQFYRGKPEVALAYYDAALEADTADAGIRLNRALALRLLGRPKEAAAERDSAIRLVGGRSAAAALLGLRIGDSEEGRVGSEISARVPVLQPARRTGKPVRIGREDVRQFLLSTVVVPADSTMHIVRSPGKSSKSRPAGSRASDETELVMVLYWKR